MTFPIERIPSSTKGEEVANIMRFDIISEKLTTGELISENTIAKNYKVSRSPAREALRILQSEGLLTLERMGARINRITQEDMEEINDMRLLLESFCMKRCSETNNPSLNIFLKYSIEQMKISIKENDFVELALQDIAFHEEIIKASGHARILHTWNGIKYIIITTLLLATEKRFLMEQDQLDSLINKHEKIVESIQSGNHKEIDTALEMHFTDTRKTVFDVLFNKES